MRKNLDLRKGKIIKIKCDECKSYLDLTEPLKELGYKQENIIDGGYFRRVFTKDGKKYRLIKVEYYNDTIYEIILKEIVEEG